MSVTKLVDYLREKGPYDQPPSLTASQEDTPPPEDQTSEDEPIEDEGEPMEGEDLRKILARVRKNLWKKRTSRKILAKMRKNL